MLEGVEAHNLPGVCWQFMQRCLPLLLDSIFVAGSAFAYNVLDFALHPQPAQCVMCLPRLLCDWSALVPALPAMAAWRWLCSNVASSIKIMVKILACKHDAEALLFNVRKIRQGDSPTFTQLLVLYNEPDHGNKKIITNFASGFCSGCD